MRIEKFEDIKSWQWARELANLVYDATRKGPFSRDFALRNQIQDAASGAMHNIAEGFDAGYDKEFVRFLKIARRSASDVQSEISLAVDREYVIDFQKKILTRPVIAKQLYR